LVGSDEKDACDQRRTQAMVEDSLKGFQVGDNNTLMPFDVVIE
jgi:hypothetical protein